ncbi:MAG: GtrA family protein [Nitrospiraceae bacterium]|nr:GtrA family protein [Nitrospiraceae bacterium]
MRELFKQTVAAENLGETAARYVLVGILNTIVASLVFAGILACGVPHRWAVLLTLIIGVVINFKTVGRFVFRSRDNGPFIRFLVLNVILYFLSVGILEYLQSRGVSLYTGGFLLAPVNAVVSFLALRVFVFPPRP